jgi:hypothetical protein
MSELTLNEKRKILRREFRQFNKDNGFRFVRPNTLLREQNDILQYLQFKIKAGYMSCEIVSQPLYIPASVFSLNISTGIQFLGKKTRSNWGASDRTAEEFALDVQDMLQLIAAGGMRWFEDMGDPENLIKNTLDQNYKLTQGYAPVLKLRTVAMSHLYLGHIDEGILYMEKLISEYSKYPSSRMGAVIVPDCQAWIDMAKKHPEEIPEKFKSIIAETRNNLRIQ